MPKEMFDVVDEEDQVIGEATREECHKEGLLHRSVMFFVFNESRKILVTKRTDNKDFFPGYWSIVLGGHVRAGESYEEAVAREVEEEVGLKVAPFFIEAFKKRIPEEKENVKVYGVVISEESRLNKDELEEGEFLDLDGLEKRLKKEKFLPETEILLPVLRRYLSSFSLQNI
jgi:isopentenyl-diphosphate delta-isomerase type 1